VETTKMKTKKEKCVPRCISLPAPLLARAMAVSRALGVPLSRLVRDGLVQRLRQAEAAAVLLDPNQGGGEPAS
jgi:hypothetical protein